MTKINTNDTRRKNVRVDEIEPGMKIAGDIEFDFGGILIPAGTILDKRKINKLKKLGTKYVYIFDEDADSIKENYDRISNTVENYNKSLSKAGRLYKRFRNEEKIEYEEIKELTFEVTTLGDDQDMIDLLTKVKNRDPDLFSHSVNVGILATLFGEWLGLEEERSHHLTQSGLLHDVGKLQIPDEILEKPGALTEEEEDILNDHPVFGFKMTEKIDGMTKEIARGVLSHHENYDGTGYPLGTKGKSIPLFGRVLAIVNQFDILISGYNDQTRISPFQAIKIFREESFGVFDYELLTTFLDKIPYYFINEKVVLSDGREAKVVFINPKNPDRPIIEVDDNYIDLYNNEDINIIRLLQSSSKDLELNNN